MHTTAGVAANVPAADIFLGSALVAIGLVFVASRRRMAKYWQFFFPIPSGWKRFGPTYAVMFGVLLAGLGVLGILMRIGH
jgi:hypothetical protein